MDTKLLVFSSVTVALRAMSLLSSKGIKANLRKTKKASAYGCSYALAVSSDDYGYAAAYLSSNGLRMLDVFDA